VVLVSIESLVDWSDSLAKQSKANMANRSDGRVEDGQWSLTTQSTFADSGIGSEEIERWEKRPIFRAPQVGTDK
jgi:hypothetical protein